MQEEAPSKEIPGTMQTVGVLVFNEDNSKVLLVKHTEAAQNEEGIYGIPAGKIELGESPKEAAIRELKEETGLVSEKNDLEQFENNFFGDYLIRTKTGESRHAHMRVYHCKGYEGELREDEKTIPEWVEVSRLAELEKMPNIEDAINNYLNSIKPGTA